MKNKHPLIFTVFCLLAISLFNSCSNNGQVLDLKQPESIVANDSFIYVSNVNGNPTDKDSNGYISKLYADGRVCENKFITGLNAPKGLCLAGNVLYIADIDRVLGFNILTKKKVMECKFLNNKTSFLNDICFDGNEDLFVTATDINEIFQINTQTKTITPLYLNNKLNAPNGIVYSNNTLYVCESGNDAVKGGICRINLSKDSSTFIRLENNIGLLDGLVLHDNKLYFSDWVDYNSKEKVATIWVYDLATQQRVALKTSENMSGCADITFNQNRIIAPLMNENKLIFIPLK